MFFFDSWGGLWFDLGPSTDHPDAVAFGPSGCARSADPAEAGLTLRTEVHNGTERVVTPWVAAREAGRVLYGTATMPDSNSEWGEWDVLA